jgi:methionine aminopeptidase
MEIDIVAEQDVLSTDNIPTAQVLSKYRLAGHFCSVAIKSVIAKCLPGVNCTELCQLGDEGILSQVQRPVRVNLDWASVSIKRARDCRTYIN